MCAGTGGGPCARSRGRPVLVRGWGRRALYFVALAPAATLAWALAQAGTVRSGTPIVETVTWVPQLGLDVALRMSTLAMLAGFVMLGEHAGSYRWSEIAGNLPEGGYLATQVG